MNKKEAINIYNYLTINDAPVKSDIIFIFGGMIMSKVWERALELYNQQYANYIIISGGIGGLTKRLGGSKPEAEVIKEYLMTHGVPSKAIITEIKSTSTLENVIFGLETLKEHNLPHNKIIITSKPFHMRRCLATFQKHSSGLEILCCPPQGTFEELIDRPQDEYYKRLVEEVLRLKSYGENGDILTQDIPPEILEIVNHPTQ